MLDAVLIIWGHFASMARCVKNGQDSIYADWFHVNEFPASYEESADFEEASNITYDTFAFTHMPKLNTANPEVQAYLLEIARYWIEEYDIDAWRLDVANEVDHAFWKNSGKHVMTQRRFLYFREIWHSSQSWLQGRISCSDELCIHR